MIKIFKARELIKKNKLKKDGKNSYSNYEYFTPEQISELVHSACKEVGILPIFQLKKDEFGLYGELAIYDNETGKVIITTVMRTESPEIKATNATQQMGGCMTYSNRYMLMSLFDIVDNNLDFDSQDNRQQVTQAKPLVTEKSWLSDKDMVALSPTLTEYKNKGVTAQDAVKAVRQKYAVSKAMEAKILNFFK